MSVASKRTERAELRRRLKAAEAGHALVASKWPPDYPPVVRAAARLDEMRASIAKLTEEIAAETPQPTRR